MMLPVRDASAPLPNPLGSERRTYRWRGHAIAYVVRGEHTPDADAPVVFVHSIHAAAWSAEWRHVFAQFADGTAGHDDGRLCYALDLLGFGASDRPPVRYTAQMYVDLLRDFLREVVRTPATLIGSSLGGTYAIAVAAAYPDVAHAVVAIGPAGVSRLYEPGGVLNHGVQALLRSNVPGTALFRALVSRRSIRFFLKDIYADPATLTPEAVEYFFDSANHPNARFAPAAFVGMSLNRDIRVAITTLECPLMLVWGIHAAQTPFRESAAVRSLVPNAAFEAVDAGDLPHEEAPEEFMTAVLPFLSASRAAA
jgi:pimeloyl-ACP methyl ester carboxylesterase